MVKSSENFLKRGRRGRANVTGDKVLTCGSSGRFLTWTFTTADHAGIGGVYPTEGRGNSVQAGLGAGAASQSRAAWDNGFPCHL